jgi:cytochrome c biogenesis protein
MTFRFFKLLADLKVAILLLLFIIFFSILGSIIEQEKAIDFYKNSYPIIENTINIINYKLILFFGLDHIFKTVWFTSLLFIFGASLISCTFLQQFPSLDFSRSLNFLKTLKQKQLGNFYKELPDNNFPFILENLRNQNFFIFQEQNKFFAYKGIIGRVGPIIVHLSIILILFGSIIAALTGFVAQEIVPRSEIFYIQNVIDSGNFNILKQCPARVNDFWINYNSKELVSQFYSNISILTTMGGEIKNLTISVNKPLEFEGLTWYQTDWDLIAIRVKINDIFYQFPLTQILNTNKKLWISWIPVFSDSNKDIILLIESLKGTFIKYNEAGKYEKIIEIGEILNFSNNMTIIPADIISSTGLQIKLDPGIIYIYIGFGLLILSSLFSYVSYSRIWVLKKLDKVKIIGTTTRSKYQFELEFLKLLNLKQI